MRGAYKGLAALIMLGVLVQAAAVAGGWFGTINEVDDGATITSDYEGNFGHALHGINGMMVMPALALIFLIASIFARRVVPGAVKWAGIVFGVTLLQVALAFAAFSAPVLGALHGINALVLLGAAARAGALTRETHAAGTGTAPGAVPTQRTGTSSTGSNLPV